MYVNVKKLRELRQSGIYDIDKMSGHQFEKYLGRLFQDLGYKTEVTRASNDFGAKEFYKADETWVVTNSEFTAATYKLAKVNRVVLINREKLIKLISQGKREKRN